MGNVIADMSTSLDGFSTGPNDGPDNPLGEGGDRLHEWMAGLGDWGERHDLTGPHAEVFRASRAHVGEPLVKQGGTTYTFVTGGIASALAQAQAAAGDKDVLLGGRRGHRWTVPRGWTARRA